jgi:hypothetical protein
MVKNTQKNRKSHFLAIRRKKKIKMFGGLKNKIHICSGIFHKTWI